MSYVSGLPKGWKREETTRQSGISAGKIDVCYISPDGKKFWTKPQMSRYIGDSVDLSNFDFSSGKFSHNDSRISVKRNKSVHNQMEYSKLMKSDASLMPPIRQTASIFKQPVTVIKNHNSLVKIDFKHGIQESPRQLFWEKRLEGLKACESTGRVLSLSNLPVGIKPIGPNIDPDTVLHSVATALHLSAVPVIGQSANIVSLEENSPAYLNPDQPLMLEFGVSDDQIKEQEEKVASARKQLELALLSFYPFLSTKAINTPAAVPSPPPQPANQMTQILPEVNNGKEKSAGRYSSGHKSANVSTHPHQAHHGKNPYKKLRVGQGGPSISSHRH